MEIEKSRCCCNSEAYSFISCLLWWKEEVTFVLGNKGVIVTIWHLSIYRVLNFDRLMVITHRFVRRYSSKYRCAAYKQTEKVSQLKSCKIMFSRSVERARCLCVNRSVPWNSDGHNHPLASTLVSKWKIKFIQKPTQKSAFGKFLSRLVA